jgi:hypothetical protein
MLIIKQKMKINAATQRHYKVLLSMVFSGLNLSYIEIIFLDQFKNVYGCV